MVYDERKKQDDDKDEVPENPKDEGDDILVKLGDGTTALEEKKIDKGKKDKNEVAENPKDEDDDILVKLGDGTTDLDEKKIDKPLPPGETGAIAGYDSHLREAKGQYYGRDPARVGRDEEEGTQMSEETPTTDGGNAEPAAALQQSSTERISTVAAASGRHGAFSVVPAWREGDNDDDDDDDSQTMGSEPAERDGPDTTGTRDVSSGNADQDADRQADNDGASLHMVEASIVPDVAEAQVIGEYKDEEEQKRKYTRRLRFIFVVSILVVCVAIGVGVGIAQRSSSDSSGQGVSTASPTVSAAPSVSNEPSESPSYSPSIAFDCALDVNITGCEIPNAFRVPGEESTATEGDGCSQFLQASQRCPSRPSRLVFLFTGSSCALSQNAQVHYISDPTSTNGCIDFLGGPPTQDGETAFVTAGITDTNITRSEFVTVGDTFSLEIYMGTDLPLDLIMVVNIFQSDQTNLRVQRFSVDVSCRDSDQPLSIGDSFGAFTLSSVTYFDNDKLKQSEITAIPTLALTALVAMRPASQQEQASLGAVSVTNSNFGFFDKTAEVKKDPSQGFTIEVPPSQPRLRDIILGRDDPQNITFTLPLNTLRVRDLTADLLVEGSVFGVDSESAPCSAASDEINISILPSCRFILDQMSCSIEVTGGDIDGSVTIDEENCRITYPLHLQQQNIPLSIETTFRYSIAYEVGYPVDDSIEFESSFSDAGPPKDAPFPGIIGFPQFGGGGFPSGQDFLDGLLGGNKDPPLRAPPVGSSTPPHEFEHVYTLETTRTGIFGGDMITTSDYNGGCRGRFFSRLRVISD